LTAREGKIQIDRVAHIVLPPATTPSAVTLTSTAEEETDTEAEKR